MYRELIEKINPKPKFNLNWYKNEDLYTDGEVEDVLIRLIAENTPENYVDAIYANFSWPVYYHLTHLRKNILNWYAFKPDSSVLEIGCGMGAITGVLCDKCKDVTAVELSKKRATATLLRCREKENLEIIVGNLNDIEFDKKFDYVTLIGVFEYQGSYTNTVNPYEDFLRKIKTLLKPDGKLLIAIENQYGLKYWCGAKEDHTGIPFEGMNQYRITDRGVRTFSKKTLEELVKRSGFKNTYFYYPMPDYKLPTVVYSEKYLPRNSNMQNMLCYYTPDKTTLVADEQGLYKDIIENEVFEFFANSFLVECTDSTDFGRITFVSCSSERQEEYRLATRFMDNGKVEKFPLTEACQKYHLQQIMKNEAALKKQGLKVLENSCDGTKICSDFVNAPLLEDCLLKAWKMSDKERVYEIFDRLYAEILKSSPEISWEENILYTLGLNITPDKEVYGPVLKNGYLDLILRNAFWMDGEIYWFDQEWILEAVPARFILFRAIAQFYASYTEFEKFCSREELIRYYRYEEAYEAFQSLERMFIELVVEQKQQIENMVYRGNTAEYYLANIRKLLNL